MESDQKIEGFEDCEIRTISFDMPNVTINLFDPEEVNYHRLDFKNVEFLIFETNHVQNVVSKIFLFNGLDEALRYPPLASFLQQRKLVDVIEEQIGNYKICYIEPVAGGDCVMIYLEMERRLGSP